MITTTNTEEFCEECQDPECPTFVPKWLIMVGIASSMQGSKIVFTSYEEKYKGKVYLFQHDPDYWYCCLSSEWVGNMEGSANGPLREGSTKEEALTNFISKYGEPQ